MNTKDSHVTVGVINWDCSLPSDTYFGSYFTSSLSPLKYRNRVPFYADVLADGTVTCHTRTVEEYEKEMQYAIDAGIDYFAYCWYDDTQQKLDKVCEETASIVDDKIYELAYARKLHAKSSLKDQLKMCAILVILHPYSDESIDHLIHEMQQDYYQDINGRPLVYLYGKGYPVDFIKRLRTASGAAGLDPYIAFMWNDTEPAGQDYSEADGTFAYACCKNGTTEYADLAALMLQENEMRKKYNIDIIPHFTVGWNPLPRVDHPVPWCSYPETQYADPAQTAGYFEAAVQLQNWIGSNSSHIQSDHILTFAWNEFEEGAYICPTKDADGNPDTTKLDVFSEIIRYWKKQ